jgi:serine/threonine protein kinase
MGTMPYAAPKMLVDGGAAAANESDDVFSCGIMLWEFLNFKKVPRPANPQELMTNRAARAQYTARLAKEIPDVFREIFCRSTAEKEEERYNRVDPLLYEIDKLIKNADLIDQINAESMDFPEVRARVFEHDRQIQKLLELMNRETMIEENDVFFDDCKFEEMVTQKIGKNSFGRLMIALYKLYKKDRQ